MAKGGEFSERVALVTGANRGIGEAKTGQVVTLDDGIVENLTGQAL